MVQHGVYVPFSSMRDVINPPKKAAFSLESTGRAAVSGLSPASVPAPRFSPMPEQDLTVWTPALLLESIVSGTRDLFLPRELRAIQIRKRDRA